MAVSQVDETTAPGAESAKTGTESRTALSALVWNFSAAVLGALLQLAYTAYTARVVLPESFGAFAAAAAALTVFGYVAGAGLATYLLRAEELTRRTVRTAYRVAVVSGTLCFLATLVFAPFAADLWGLPEITPIVRLYGLFFLTQPASLVATAALRRIGYARGTALTETAAQFVGMACGAALLAAGWSPYGLVAAQVITPTVTLVVAAARLARCALPDGPEVSVADVLGVSSAFAVYGIIQMVAADVALWAVARRFGPDAAGQFSRAILVVSLPASLLVVALRRAVMPSLARINAERRSLAGALPDVLSVGSALGFVSFGVLAGVGHPAVGLLLGPGWETAGTLVTVFALGWPLVLLCQFSYAVDEVTKALMALFRTQLLVLCATVALVAVAATAARSLYLIAVAGCVAAGVGHVAQLLRWQRAGLGRAAGIVRPYAVHALLGGALFVAGRLGVRCAGSGAVGQIVYGLAAMLPVVIVALACRRHLPVYKAAVARGLVIG